MRRIAEGVWIDAEPLRVLGMRLTATMAVLRLRDGSLLIHSPIGISEGRRTAVDGLGRVAHLYAPNLYHHRWIGEWASAYPRARLHAPAGLARRRPDLRIDRVHGPIPEPAFDGVIEERPIGGFRLQESVLLHRPTRTLLVADLVHNVGRPRDPWTKLYARWMGFYDRVAISRMIRWTGFSDRAAARRSLDGLLALPFDRVVVGHGAPVPTGGKRALAAAFSWLPTAGRRSGASSGGEPVEIRPLARHELEALWSIDRAEVIEHVYRRRGSELVLEPERHDVSGWPPGEAERYRPLLRDCIDQGGVCYGAFHGDTLVGAAVLESRFIGRQRDRLQLKFLHVSRSHRRSGVGSRLFDRAVARARELGAARLYVSATPSENTVRFYHRRGCRVTDDVDPALWQLEPDDIHLELEIPELNGVGVPGPSAGVEER